jgi:nucleotide-binding universal stress UspA family protein
VYRQIMVPLDGSKFAEAALPLALTLSRKTGAAVHIVTVIEPVPAFAYEEWASAAEEWTKEYLAKLGEAVSEHAGGAVTSSVLSGHVVDALQKESGAKNVDLVVMASHGRGTISRLWLGSVADRFVRQADRPVLLVRPDEEALPALDHDASYRQPARASRRIRPVGVRVDARHGLRRALRVGLPL